MQRGHRSSPTPSSPAEQVVITARTNCSPSSTIAKILSLSLVFGVLNYNLPGCSVLCSSSAWCQLRFLASGVMSVIRFGKVLTLISSDIISVHIPSSPSGFPTAHTLDFLTVSHISFLCISGFSVVLLCSSCFRYVDLCFDVSVNLLVRRHCVHSVVTPT